MIIITLNNRLKKLLRGESTVAWLLIEIKPWRTIGSIWSKDKRNLDLIRNQKISKSVREFSFKKIPYEIYFDTVVKLQTKNGGRES